MKRIFLITSFLFIGHCLFAQKINIGLQGGINMASINANAPQNFDGGSQAHATFQFGVTVDYLFQTFNVQSGVLLTGKGNTSTTVQNLISNGSPVPYYQTNSTNVSYIEVPVNLLYKHSLRAGTLYFGAGPYVAYALWGSYSSKIDMNEYYKRASSTSISFGNGTDQLRSFDYGVNVVANFVMNNRLKLGLNYGLGLNNVSNSGLTSQNRVASLVIGYNFK